MPGILKLLRNNLLNPIYHGQKKRTNTTLCVLGGYEVRYLSV